jgi:hypothetical protein
MVASTAAVRRSSEAAASAAAASAAAISAGGSAGVGAHRSHAHSNLVRGRGRVGVG